MANEYLKPQKPLKDLNSENYFYPLTTSDQIFLSDTTTRLSSLLDHTNFIASRAIYYDGTKLLSSGNIFLNDSQIGINRTSLDAAYKFSVVGNSLFNGILYFANGTTYYINNSGTANLNAITAYSSYTLNTASTVDSLAMNIYTRAGTSSIGTRNYTNTTIDQGAWGQIYYRTPALHKVYETAGDTSSTVTSSSYYQPYWWFRQWSLNTSTGARTSYREDYYLPPTDNDRTTNGSYKILTTKNLADADSRFVTLGTNQTITGVKTFSGKPIFTNGFEWKTPANITCTIGGSGNEWSIDLSPGSTTGTYWHVWSSTNSASILQCFNDNRHVVIPVHLAVGGYNNTSYGLSTNSFICNSWVRTVGNTGWYSETHGGGWYMTDTTWLRSYNNKNIYSGSGIIRSDNGVWGNKVLINSNWIGFYNAVQGSTRYGYVQADANRMYFRKENGVLDNIAFDFSGGKVYNNNEFITIGSTGFRIVHNSRGAFWHWNASSGQKWFYLMFTAENAGINGGWTSVRAFYANADTGYTYHTRAYSAVWNDYAEFRKGKITEPGRVVIEHKSGIMQLCEERLAPGAKIISDTYGFAIGETKECKTPIAVTGRVLVYPYQNRNKYPLGAAVCSAPNGTVDIMTREEIKEYPECIVGTVSEIPDYEIWRAGGSTQDGPAEEIKVNGRIWVYVR